MTQERITLQKTAPAVYRAIAALDDSAKFDPTIRELVRIRTSQINGCTYCMDYHSGDALTAGEDVRRLLVLNNWRETPLFDERERAALALAEAMTRLPDAGVPEDVYAEAAEQFEPEELGNLIGVIIAINAWNLLGVSTALQPAVEAAVA
jgi:AhpD family alkylhydroperoxidase